MTIELHVHHPRGAMTVYGYPFNAFDADRPYDVELYDDEGREDAEQRIAALREAGVKVEVVGGAS